jgi:hypothetical protein
MFRGTHAPSRAHFGALAEMPCVRRARGRTFCIIKSGMARASSPARAARALPGDSLADLVEVHECLVLTEANVAPF